MQSELETEYPALDIQLVGVNHAGKEAGNESATEGRDIPLLQDVDADSDGTSDAWGLWDVAWRDVVILDGHNAKVDTYNLTTYNLAEPENYDRLREMLIDAAMQSQKPWQNARDQFDVNDSGYVSPIDVLMIVNMLNAAGSHELPPPTPNSSPPPYFDCNGDGNLTPLDALQVVNTLNNSQRVAVGEGEASLHDGWLAALPATAGTVHDRAEAGLSASDLGSEGIVFASHQPSKQRPDSATPGDTRLANIDRVFAAVADWRTEDPPKAIARRNADSDEQQLDLRLPAWPQLADELALSIWT